MRGVPAVMRGVRLPTKNQIPAVLQDPNPFHHSGMEKHFVLMLLTLFRWFWSGANGQNRTDDPRFTKALLYRLSYVGADGILS